MKTLLLFPTMFFICGCAMNSALRSDGIPQDRYRAGGGFQIEYKAPTTGTVYLVEENQRRIILSETLEEEEWFHLDMNPSETDTQSRLLSLGVEPKTARLVLYFVPAAPDADN